MMESPCAFQIIFKFKQRGAPMHRKGKMCVLGSGIGKGRGLGSSSLSLYDSP